MKTIPLAMMIACPFLSFFSQALAQQTNAASCSAPIYTSSKDGYCGDHVCDQCQGGSAFSPCVPLPSPETSCNCPQDCAATAEPGGQSDETTDSPRLRTGKPASELPSDGGSKVDIPPPPAGSPQYRSVSNHCSSIPIFNPLPANTGSLRLYYKYVVPKGTYRMVALGFQPNPSWSSFGIMVAKKDGYITDSEFNRIVAGPADSSVAHGENGYYYSSLGRSGSGTSFAVSYPTADGSITQAPDKIATFHRDTFYTAILDLDRIGQNTSGINRPSMHAIFCANSQSYLQKDADYGSRSLRQFRRK